MPATTFQAKSLTELLAIRARDQADVPFLYTGIQEDEGIVLRSLTFSQVQKAADRLAWHYSKAALVPNTEPGHIPTPQIIAVLTSSAFDESLLEIALAKLGLTALLLSVNNSVAAVAHLIKLTKATHLVYGTKFVAEANEAQEILKAEGYELGIVPDKRFPLWGPEGVENATIKAFPAALTPEQETDRPGVILHSSGSTGFPKPVFITHYGLIANVAINQNLPGFSTLPVFHGYGHFAIFRCMYAGRPVTLFPPHLPLTSANIVNVWKASPPVRQCYAVPYVIKLLAETEEGVNCLASFDVVSYAGAPLPDDLGDRLVAAGVNLLSIYGTTETGSLLNSTRDFASDKLWNWVAPVPSLIPYLTLEPHGKDTFEVIVRDGYPPKIETNRPDGSYATKDLFQRHPTLPNRFRYIGRLDDTLVHTLGEKTNPVPMELAIRGNSPYVAEAIVFGAGRAQTGCLILPSELAKNFTPEQLMESIWPVIEDANSQAPTHSRLLPEMIEFLPYGTHVPVATKMSILRPACYAKFKDNIDRIYKRFESTDEGQEKLRLEKAELEEYILKTIAKTLGNVKSAKLNKTVDLFSFGVDSLQGTRIRNAVQKELDLNGETLGQNVVYEHPSVQKLSEYILSLQSGNGSASNNVDTKMLAMVEKYLAALHTRSPAPGAAHRPDDARVVVLTGATGSLGAHILYQLVGSPKVRKVVCLSRASSHADSLERVRDSLKIRRLVLADESKLVSYSSNANTANLGLSEEEYASIEEEVTDVIHNAWPVNFVLSIDSYDEHVRGTANLMNLCLSSPYAEPARFYFSSSISCRQGAHDATCDEDYSSSPSTAVKTGYAQSKWVVEKLCQQANQKVGLPVGVLRIGQMVGDSVNGVWNETEAWPLMFKSANVVGALPSVTENPSWLPVDYAGRGIAEIVLTTELAPSAVYHIVNPDNHAGWNEILDGLEAGGLKFDRVDRNKWVELLATSDPDPAKNPSIKLLSFFKMRYSAPDGKPTMVFKTNETSKVAPSIGAAPGLSQEMVSKWVLRWKETGFVQ